MALNGVGADGALSPLSQLLNSYVPIPAEDLARVDDGLCEPRTYPPNTEIRAEGDPGRVLTIASGWVAEAALMEDGRRQIVNMLMAGDVVDFGETQRMGLSVIALTTVRTFDIGRLMGRLAGPDGQLARAWRLNRQAAQARLVRHVVRLGRLTAYARTADLMLELHERQRRVGLASQRTLHMPLTQEMLGDHLGLSIVHVNRTLQQMRRDGLIDYQGGRAVIRDPEALARAAGLWPGPAAAAPARPAAQPVSS